jgi:NitT/TauT family transport system substrate-binding protein
MNRNSEVAIAIIVVIALVGFGAWYLAGSPEPSATPAEPVIVAYSPFESTALLWVAEDRHLFERNGLNVTLRRYDSGAESLDGVVHGEADVTVGVTEFPLVRKALQEVNVSAIGTIDKGEFIYLVARKDRGIVNVSDLKGKRVGTTTGTIAEFHLGRFLALNGMTMKDITLVDIKTPEGWANEVADGNIDAISTSQPYASAARDRLGDTAVMWSAQSRQPLFALVVSTNTWIAGHPVTVRKFLNSLAEAEEYTNTHPAEARAIVQQRLNLTAAYMPAVWQQNQFSLSLDQSLITAMEDEARWMIENRMTNATAMPDFRNYISTNGLADVKPGSVNIIQERGSS